MAAGFLIMRHKLCIVLVCMLSELVHSAAIPEARTASYPESRSDEKEKPQLNSYGSRRPLTYIRNLRERLKNKTEVQTETQMPLENFIRIPSPRQILHSLSHRILNKYWQRSGHAAKQPQPLQQGYEDLLKPRGFLLQHKDPFLNLLHAVKDTTSGSKGSHIDKDGNEGVQSFSRPTSKVEEKQERFGSFNHNNHLQPVKPQSSQTIFGTRKPVTGPLNFEKQTHKPQKSEKTQEQMYKPIQITLTEGKRPDDIQPPQEDNHLVHTKPQSGPTFLLGKSPSSSSATQQTYIPVKTNLQSSATQSGLTMFGPGRPFGSSSAAKQTQQIYDPAHTQLQLNFPQIEEKRPFQSSAGPGGQTFKPVQAKLPSSHPAGSKPLSDSVAEQYMQMRQPVQSSSTPIGAEKPLFGSAGAAQQTLQSYKPPDESQPLGSTELRVERPSLGSAHPAKEMTQQAYSRLHANQQSSPNFEEQPSWSATAHQPSYNQQQSSSNIMRDRSFACSAARQQNQQQSDRLPDDEKTSKESSNEPLKPGNQITQSRFPLTINEFSPRTASRIDPSQASNNQQMAVSVYSSNVIPLKMVPNKYPTVSHAASTKLQAVSDTKYKRPPSRLDSVDEKPIGSSYFQPRAIKQLNTPLAIPPENHNKTFERFNKQSRQKPPLLRHLTISRFLYHRPPVGLLNKESAATGNAENKRELAEKYFLFSNPKTNGSNQQASISNHLSSFHSLSVQTQSDPDDTEIGFGQNPHAYKLDEKTSYSTMSIDVGDERNMDGPSFDPPISPPLPVEQNQPSNVLSKNHPSREPQSQSQIYSKTPCVNSVNGQCPDNPEVPRELKEIMTYNQFSQRLYSHHEGGTASFAQQAPTSALPIPINHHPPKGRVKQHGGVKCHVYSLHLECQKNFHPEILYFNR